MSGSRRVRAVAAATLAALVSVLAVVTAPAQAEVLTISVDTLRTGWDRGQPRLTPSDVGAQDFGQLFATQLDGSIYAQPVVAKGTLVVVTENDMAYGLDPVTGAIRWSRDVGPAWAVANLGCGDLVPNIGITATPAVDRATGTAYFTAKVDDKAKPDNPRWEMHAIDITTGAERAGFPTVITGSPDNDPTNTFAPRTAMQRPGLLLLDGVVYAGFASHCDKQPYVGYVVGIDATTGARTAMWATETGSSTAGAGIWQSGGGLVSDGPGQIIVSTGNGVSPVVGPGKPPSTTSFAESIIRLQVRPDRTLEPTDFFSPVNNTNLDTDDTDLGSGAPVGLPAEHGFGTPDHPNLLVLAGKDGRVLLLDRDDLGGVGQGPGGSDAVLQSAGPYKGVWGHPAVWGGDGGYVYLVPSGAPLSAFKYGLSGTGVPSLTRTGTSTLNFGFSSGSPVVTSNGRTSGSALVWVVYAQSSSGSGGQLRAYDAVPSKGTMTLRYAAPIGAASKFATPATDSGRVYVGNRTGQVYGFGRPTSIPLAGAPTDFGLVPVATASTKQVVVTAQKDLTISKIATTAPFSAGAVTLPKTLAAGTSLTVPVTYKPTAAGSVLAGIVFTTNAGTYAFDVHGFGTTDGLLSDPPSLDFGEVPVRGKVTLSVSVSNSGGTPTEVTGAKAPAAPFVTESLPAAGASLATGASVSVPVTFAPTAATASSSEVVVTSSSGTVRIPVKGVGVEGQPEMTLTPEQVDFGDVEIGRSATKTFDIANTGNLLMTLTKAAPPTAPFLVPDPVAEGQQLKPGEAVHQAVTFAPTKTGAFSGSYTITSNDGRGAREVVVTGSGVPTVPVGPVKHVAGKCVDVRGSKTVDQTPVMLYTCNGTAAQVWRLEKDGTVRALGRCLDTAAGGKVKGTKVVISPCSGAATQQWAPRTGTAKALVNVTSQLCLEVPGNKPANLLQLWVWSCSWSDAQRFTLPSGTGS